MMAEPLKEGPSSDEKKERLLSGLVDVRGRILMESSRFSPDRIEVRFVGTWAIKDLLAHLSGWDITNLEAAKEILEGKVPSFYAYHDRDWASYNASLVKEYKRKELRTQLSLLAETHEQLIHFLETIPVSELFKDKGIRNKGYKVILSTLLEVEKKDEETHLRQIIEFVDSLHSPD
ncbi:MAG: hypothetical protein A2Z14_08385 [Chloroflexi bacterium RBG_16_48_8]|nr:MAG: hypothetical protein A2Z14_08385 [Chloroflexi bacterium RBG_16_48_8]